MFNDITPFKKVKKLRPRLAIRGITAIAIIGAKLSNTARRTILLGSLSYEPRGNLSKF
jgi:hypothetical protein